MCSGKGQFVEITSMCCFISNLSKAGRLLPARSCPWLTFQSLQRLPWAKIWAYMNINILSNRHDAWTKEYFIYLLTVTDKNIWGCECAPTYSEWYSKYCIYAIFWVPFTPDFNSWLQGFNGPLPASWTVLNAKVESPIDHYALVVKRSIPCVMGVVAHFLKVVLLARLDIFQENSDMEVTVGSGVFVHSTWDCSVWWSIKNNWWT